MIDLTPDDFKTLVQRDLSGEARAEGEPSAPTSLLGLAHEIANHCQLLCALTGESMSDDIYDRAVNEIMQAKQGQLDLMEREHKLLKQQLSELKERMTNDKFPAIRALGEISINDKLLAAANTLSLSAASIKDSEPEVADIIKSLRVILVDLASDLEGRCLGPKGHG